VRAVLGETFRLLGSHLHLFTLISLTVWLPTHVVLNYLEFFDPGEDSAGRALRIVLTAQVVLDPFVASAMLSALARIKQGGGIAGHNGLKDISTRLGSHDYWRLRIGIGHPGDPQAVTDFVLHKPSQEDRSAIDSALARVLEVLPLVLAGDHQGAMLKLHTEAEPAKVERPVKPEPVRPAKAEPVEKKKARKAERPDKPGKAAQADKTGKAGKSGKDDKAGKAGLISSFLKKFLPGPDAARKK